MMGSVGEGGLGIDIQMKQWQQYGGDKIYIYEETAKAVAEQLESDGFDTQITSSGGFHTLWFKERS